MRSLNDFADQLPNSYASAHNAQASLDRNARANDDNHLLDSPPNYSTAIIQRTDGRFAAIVINPDQDSMYFFLDCTNIGVFDIFTDAPRVNRDFLTLSDNELRNQEGA